jgi:uncharacterized membrane protein YhaH (DUF805 family)
MSAPQSHSIEAVSLSAPLHGASLRDAVRRVFTKYATFSGRASRSEYWWWYLVSFVVSAVLGSLALATGGASGVEADGTAQAPGAGYWVFMGLLAIWGLATLIPSIALLVRRLHDANNSALNLLIVILPIGGLVLLVLALMPSKPEGARFDR